MAIASKKFFEVVGLNPSGRMAIASDSVGTPLKRIVPDILATLFSLRQYLGVLTAVTPLANGRSYSTDVPLFALFSWDVKLKTKNKK